MEERNVEKWKKKGGEEKDRGGKIRREGERER